MIEINYLAALVAGVVGMAVGAIWYHPKVFGNAWKRLSGLTEESMAAAKAKGMGKSYAIGTLGHIVMAWVLATSLAAWVAATGATAGSTLNIALQGAFWNWLGFVAPALLGSVLWEGKSWKYYFLNVFYYLVALIVMALVISYWK